MRSFSTFLFIAILLAGCAVPTSGWRDDAFSRFNSALTAGSQQFAPEETENIRQTLVLADRYLNGMMPDEADRLYQLSCQKSQLLYRNLVLSKVRQESVLIVEAEKVQPAEKIAIEHEPVSILEVVPEAEQAVRPVAIKTDPDYVVPQSLSTAVPIVKFEPVSNARRIKKHTELTGLKQRPAELSSRIDQSGTTIYLTFDDGPSRLTLPIASYLKSQGVAATFFVLGKNVKGHEKAIVATVAMGHRVGNHTLSHDLSKLEASFQHETSEVGTTAAMIEKLGGDGRMVRIPYGASTRAIISKVSADGGQIFDWDINSNDSTRRGAKDPVFIEQTVINQLKNSRKRHIILLFHDGVGHDATLTALRNLIPRLKQEGYRFGLLSRSDKIARSDQTVRSLP